MKLYVQTVYNPEFKMNNDDQQRLVPISFLTFRTSLAKLLGW